MVSKFFCSLVGKVYLLRKIIVVIIKVTFSGLFILKLFKWISS